ncbi:glutathione S-transferase family protein [uncultured Paracoccus sp.]|uniref:glutathione S-transferase family protein n=1 Tax=uncultured Paracoccus sp. TaxID=189685 RepID=UPI0025925DF4|nr:glutathione S-transferase family protein [uncultured Paracoccus sp.]
MLTLYYHPLASYCWKPLIALYEAGTAFTPRLVDLAQPDDAALLERLWPMRLFPVLEDGDTVLPESSIIIEYLDLHHPGPHRLIPADPKAALQVRLWDRFFDMHMESPVQEIVRDALRPESRRDRQTVDEQKEKLDRAYIAAERHLAACDNDSWIAGAFSLADCAAMPALFYAGAIHPFYAHPALSEYFTRLTRRPSAGRVIEGARPWFQYFPFRQGIAAQFLA